MHIIRKRTISAVLAALLLCITLLSGCLPRPDEALPGGTSGAAETTASGDAAQKTYDHYEENALQEQQRFDQEMEDLFRTEVSSSQIDLHFMLRNPSAYGIEQAECLYPSLSPESLETNRQDQEDLGKLLKSFDPSLLTDDQRLTLQILQSYLKTEQMADGLDLYYQPLATTIGIQAQLPILLAEYCFYTKKDVEDYLQLIGGLDEYYQDILDFEKRKADAGLMMSDKTIDHVIESCESYLLVPGDNFLIETFNSRLDGVEGLTEEEKSAYQQQNAALLESDFVPAYQLLIDGLTALKGTGTNDKGQCGYPKGREYYQYQVYSATGTSYASVDDLLADVEDTMEDAMIETSLLLRQYPDLMNEYDSYQFCETEPGAIMEKLKVLTQKDYPALPACSYTLKAVPKALELSLSPAFYLTSPLDDYENNVIYINGNERFADNDLFNVIAHEGYPGHLYQNVYFHTCSHADIRKLLSFPGYSEGWATYVEREAYMLDNGLKPEMGKLLAENSIATLGLHACLDIYINYKGWSKEEVKKYLQTYYAQPDDVVENLYDAMVENPANYLSYFVGCMEILNMRRTAEAQLKDKFNLKEFHTFILNMGDAPFDVIQAYFSAWLLTQHI